MAIVVLFFFASAVASRTAFSFVILFTFARILWPYENSDAQNPFFAFLRGFCADVFEPL